MWKVPVLLPIKKAAQGEAFSHACMCRTRQASRKPPLRESPANRQNRYTQSDGHKLCRAFHFIGSFGCPDDEPPVRLSQGELDSEGKGALATFNVVYWARRSARHASRSRTASTVLVQAGRDCTAAPHAASFTCPIQRRSQKSSAANFTAELLRESGLQIPPSTNQRPVLESFLSARLCFRTLPSRIRISYGTNRPG
jgi:hypothetical protein